MQIYPWGGDPRTVSDIEATGDLPQVCRTHRAGLHDVLLPYESVFPRDPALELAALLAKACFISTCSTSVWMILNYLPFIYMCRSCRYMSICQEKWTCLCILGEQDIPLVPFHAPGCGTGNKDLPCVQPSKMKQAMSQTSSIDARSFLDLWPQGASAGGWHQEDPANHLEADMLSTWWQYGQSQLQLWVQSDLYIVFFRFWAFSVKYPFATAIIAGGR